MLVTMIYMYICKTKSGIFYMTTKIQNDQHSRCLMLCICWAWISLTTLEIEFWIVSKPDATLFLDSKNKPILSCFRCSISTYLTGRAPPGTQSGSTSLNSQKIETTKGVYKQLNQGSLTLCGTHPLRTFPM
jgi:hypothetical protein